MSLARQLFVAVAVGLLAFPVGALQNQLIEHPSPYLAMHGDDPVAWQDWGEDAVAHARETGKLLFVSSGYFSCHWCHVMQRESYRDPEIAAQLNRHFVPVKLDRELHSALDAFLIDYVEQTTGQAGWPLNVFLTPEGYPLIGATYLPPDRFNELLVRIHRVWTDAPGRMRNLARRTLLQLQFNETEGLAEPLSPTRLRQRLLQDTLQIADSMQGGFGEQSRFPMAPQLLALLDLQHVNPDPRLAEFLTLTLDQIAARGLRDHLGGGFFRYTVDPGWLVPHFEKMLYTQALLAEVFMRAADVFRRDDYAEVARDTLHFVAREMRGPLGGYVASFSAVDGAGREGAVYLWAVEDLHRVLGEVDTSLARRYWAMLDIPPFDFGHLPMRGESIARIATMLELDPAELKARLHDVRLTLLTERARRELPVDHKELAGWNGLMLAAFSKAARRWNDPVFDYAAERIHAFVTQTLWTGSSLHRAVRRQADGGIEPVGSASLADYAYVAYGISEYARLRGDPRDQTFVTALLSLAWHRFHGPGGWRMDDQVLIPGMSEQAAMREGALPAPSSLLMRLAAAGPSPSLAKQGVAAIEYGRSLAQAAPFWYAGHVSALLEIAAHQRPEGFATTLPKASAHQPSPLPSAVIDRVGPAE